MICTEPGAGHLRQLLTVADIWRNGTRGSCQYNNKASVSTNSLEFITSFVVYKIKHRQGINSRLERRRLLLLGISVH